jgi:hypothetical protein
MISFNNCLASIVSINFEHSSLAGSYLDYPGYTSIIANHPVQIGTIGLGLADVTLPPTNYEGGPNESSSYLKSGTGSAIFIQSNGNDVFSLLSLELGEYGENDTGNKFVTITGNTNVGDTVSRTFELDRFFDGPGGTNDFQLFTLDASWNNLTSIQLDSSDYSLDNIQLDLISVPVPAAAWLFGTGLLGLFGGLFGIGKRTKRV